MSGALSTRDLLSLYHPPRSCASPRREQLDQLAAQIRAFLIDNVSRTGGHLGPSLGCRRADDWLASRVPLPQDTIVFDTGHQAYDISCSRGVRIPSRAALPGGLSGPSRSESEHDMLESSMRIRPVAWVDGISREAPTWGTRGGQCR